MRHETHAVINDSGQRYHDNGLWFSKRPTDYQTNYTELYPQAKAIELAEALGARVEER